MHRTQRSLTLVVVTATLALTGCAKGDTTHTTSRKAPSTSTSASAAPSESTEADPDTALDGAVNVSATDLCANAEDAPVTGPAVKVFGKDAVLDARCEMINFMYHHSYMRDLMKVDRDEAKKVQFDFAHEYMTTSTQDAWDQSVNTWLTSPETSTGEEKAGDAWWSLAVITVPHVVLPGYGFPDDRPAMVGGSFSPARTGVDEKEGQKRLLLGLTFKTEIRMFNEDQTKQMAIPVKKTLDFTLVRTGDEEHTWLIDYYHGRLDSKKAHPVGA